jgi:hypothetical protein
MRAIGSAVVAIGVLLARRGVAVAASRRGVLAELVAVRVDPKGTAGTAISGTIYVSSVSFKPGKLTFDFLFGSEYLFPTASNVVAFHSACTIAAP